MTDLKNARAALEAKRREKAKIDAEYAALEQQIATEKARKETGRKLECAEQLLLANAALRDELSRYSVRESRVILQRLLGSRMIADAFGEAARQAEPELAKIRAKAERDKQAKARREEQKKLAAGDEAATAEDKTDAAAEGGALAAEERQQEPRNAQQAAPQNAQTQAAVRTVRPPAMPRTVPAPMPRD